MLRVLIRKLAIICRFFVTLLYALAISFCFSASSSSKRSHGTLLIDLESFAPAPFLLPLPLAAAASSSALPSTASMCSRRWRCLVLILASSPNSIGTGVPPVPAGGGGPKGVDAAAPYLFSYMYT